MFFCLELLFRFDNKLNITPTMEIILLLQYEFAVETIPIVF